MDTQVANIYLEKVLIYQHGLKVKNCLLRKVTMFWELMSTMMMRSQQQPMVRVKLQFSHDSPNPWLNSYPNKPVRLKMELKSKYLPLLQECQDRKKLLKRCCKREKSSLKTLKHFKMLIKVILSMLWLKIWTTKQGLKQVYQLSICHLQ